MMKKGLGAIVLVLSMVLSLFAVSCGEVDPDSTITADDIMSNLVKNPESITLYIPVNPSTTEEALASVEFAINELLKPKFRTAIKLIGIPEEEYKATVDQLLKYNDYIKEMAEREDEDEDEDAEGTVAEPADTEPEEPGEGEETEEPGEGEEPGDGEEAEPGEGEDGEEEEEDEFDLLAWLDEKIEIKAYAVERVKYPPVVRSQLDIFVVLNNDDFITYNRNERLRSMDEYFSVTSKVLNYFLFPSFLNAGKYNGSVRAIPTNGPIGEYEFMLIDKVLADKYGYTAEDFVDFFATEEFLMKVRDGEGIVPVLNIPQPNTMDYIYDSRMPVAVYNSKQSPNRYGALENQYANPSIVEYFKTMARFRAEGLLPEPILPPDPIPVRRPSPPKVDDLTEEEAAEALAAFEKEQAELEALRQFQYEEYFNKEYDYTKEFAVAFRKGSYGQVRQWEKEDGRSYYAVIYRYPKATNENTFMSGFAISAFSSETKAKRAMEVITRINKDSQLRDLLAYGVLGVHYDLDVNGQVVRINNDYSVNIEYTGNLFMANTEAGYGDPKWENAKLQNLDSYPSATLGFKFRMQDNLTRFQSLINVTAPFLSELVQATDEDEIDEILAALNASLKTNEINDILNAANPSSFANAYESWKASVLGG